MISPFLSFWWFILTRKEDEVSFRLIHKIINLKSIICNNCFGSFLILYILYRNVISFSFFFWNFLFIYYRLCRRPDLFSRTLNRSLRLKGVCLAVIIGGLTDRVGDWWSSFTNVISIQVYLPVNRNSKPFGRCRKIDVIFSDNFFNNWKI